MSYINHLKESIDQFDPITLLGRVQSIKGELIESLGPPCELKELVEIEINNEQSAIGEVVGFHGDYIQIMPYESIYQIKKNCRVAKLNSPLTLVLNESLKGRILNARGLPIDQKKLPWGVMRSVFQPAPHVLKRSLIDESISVGIKGIDAALTIGKGQRMGIFSGPGVGKSVLLSMIAKNSQADINVIALVGERGREVKEFIERNLGEEGLKKSVVIVATSDDPPLARVRSVFTATTIAEYFRDLGLNVMLMVDSLTRMSLAQREVSVSLNEPSVTRGFPPSLFHLLPMLIERAGKGETGSITAFYTILTEGDGLDDPVGEAVMSLLDGHIILSRKLANKAIYPAIDLSQSISRLMVEITDEPHCQAALKLREWISLYDEMEEMINIGAYTRGNNPNLDVAIDQRENIIKFLKQNSNESVSMTESLNQLMQLVVNEKP